MPRMVRSSSLALMSRLTFTLGHDLASRDRSWQQPHLAVVMASSACQTSSTMHRDKASC